jgi:hypothetical protein
LHNTDITSGAAELHKEYHVLRFRRVPVALIALLAVFVATRTTSAQFVLHLPYPSGVSVSILQGYNGGTHQGVERYSLDLVRDDGKTSNSPALAPAAGTVVWAYAPGERGGCIGIQIDGGGGLHEMLCHIFLNHAYQNGDHVGSGQELGTVGPPGTVQNNGTSHIHLQVYRVLDGQRTPAPFAAPDGAPLEGISLAAGTSYNQWACNSSGPGCHIVSQNGAPSGTASPTPSTGIITSASAGGTAGATISSPRQQTGPLAVGTPVAVSGTGDCLRVHDQPTTSANVVNCLPDGTQSVITDGPRSADGYTWYRLDSAGWSVGDYLTATGPASTATGSNGTGAAATSSGSTSAPPPAPQNPTSAPAAPPAPAAPSGVTQPIGVTFVAGASVTVSGTGDCLRVHDQPSVSATVLDCLPDGTKGVVADGPVQADGLVWWDLDGHGWVDGEYLKVPS